jgi:hypothetical protein
VELLVQLVGDDGREGVWPVAVVAESADDKSVVFRTYCSQWPVDGRRHLRPPVLPSGSVELSDVVARYQAALAAGDTDETVNSFGEDGYLREPTGPNPTHRGAVELHTYFGSIFSAGGGIGLQQCAVTDDGVRCALEYNCIRWGQRTLPSQAGLVVHERGSDGLLGAVRVYDDVEPPVRSGSTTE